MGLKFEHVPGKITDFAVMIQKGEVEAFIGWEPLAAAIAQAPDLLHYTQRLPPIPNSEACSWPSRPPTPRQTPTRSRSSCARTLKGIEWIKANGKEKTARADSQENERPEVLRGQSRRAGIGGSDAASPRHAVHPHLAHDHRQARENPGGAGEGCRRLGGKYLDYSFLDKAEAALKKN
jgi:hypothetical protein